MGLALGQMLKIRSSVYVAAEPVPFFWPMRTFIHHNPLHSLEHLTFHEAVNKGEKLFHGRGFLPRSHYQRYLAEGKVDRDRLASEVETFLSQYNYKFGFDFHRLLFTLLSDIDNPVMLTNQLAAPSDIYTAWQGGTLSGSSDISRDSIAENLRGKLLGDRPVYEAVDALYGTKIGTSLDELVIKSCLDFFDEGQSVWSMPERERGFFPAWRQIAKRNIRLFLRGLNINEILEVNETPEGIITHVMNTLQVPADNWVGYFTRELARLHGWAGFIRWRASAKRYYWNQRFPADLVDYLAVRLTLGLALLSVRGRRHIAHDVAAIEEQIEQNTLEMYLRQEFYGSELLPAMAHRVDDALSRNSSKRIESVFSDYVKHKREYEARRQADRLRKWAIHCRAVEAIDALPVEDFVHMNNMLRDFEQQEGMIWLRAMESHAMSELISGVSLSPSPPRKKRPFAEALFCIDTRSERIRRKLESIGDYQTYGIAGFFGVPVSFMELGKGSETHLCPVILTPKNLVLEMTPLAPMDNDALTTLEKAMHELKESVLTPFVTVEAIGLLFGFDMVGKTLAPQTYNRWRKRLHQRKPTTRLMLDKLTKEQADSIVRAVQRAMIVKAVTQELRLESERITDDLVRELREAAMGNSEPSASLAAALRIDENQSRVFVERLRETYRINPSFAQVQMERLGRIGFSLDEQTHFVRQALRSIGLTDNFSRFILLVGHGSTSENNPYESALDCGACGGNHGLVSARVLAQMANKPEIRRRLREKGIDIADDAWFTAALHNTTTDELIVHDLELMPPTHLIYLDRLRKGLKAASRLSAQERMPTLQPLVKTSEDLTAAYRLAQRNALDWSQVRPEWGLSGNAYFIIGQRALTQAIPLNGRAFLHSYDYRLDRKRRLLENILTGPLVVGQWINMEHYFSTVDNECFGSGSKVYHNVAGRFGVMTGNLSDLRTGLPSQTVLENGRPYHQPIRLITLVEAPFDHAIKSVESVVAVKHLVRNGWVRLVILDPETATVHIYDDGEWRQSPHHPTRTAEHFEESSDNEKC